MTEAEARDVIARVQKANDAIEFAIKRIDELKAENKALKEALAQPEQEPSYWLGYGLQAHTEKPFEGATPLYTKSQL